MRALINIITVGQPFPMRASLWNDVFYYLDAVIEILAGVIASLVFVMLAIPLGIVALAVRWWK